MNKHKGVVAALLDQAAAAATLERMRGALKN